MNYLIFKLHDKNFKLFVKYKLFYLKWTIKYAIFCNETDMKCGEIIVPEPRESLHAAKSELF